MRQPAALSEDATGTERKFRLHSRPLCLLSGDAVRIQSQNRHRAHGSARWRRSQPARRVALRSVAGQCGPVDAESRPRGDATLDVIDGAERQSGENSGHRSATRPHGHGVRVAGLGRRPSATSMDADDPATGAARPAHQADRGGELARGRWLPGLPVGRRRRVPLRPALAERRQDSVLAGDCLRLDCIHDRRRDSGE